MSDIDLMGKRFGRLTVITLDHKKDGFNYWKCQCECGNFKVVRGDSLEKGSTKSCGCLIGETAKKIFAKHGMCGTRVYRIWNGITQRCHNKNDTTYQNYGGKGIAVCDEWRKDFRSFYAWAMANGYRDDLTIDRIDNSKGYSPDNCRWATTKEQARNKTDNHLITHDGKTMCINDWRLEKGFSRNLIEERLKRGWSVERAISTPPNKKYSKGRKLNNGTENL